MKTQLKSGLKEWILLFSKIEIEIFVNRPVKQIAMVYLDNEVRNMGLLGVLS